MADAKRALKFIGDPAFDALAGDWLGDHPVVVKALAKIGKAFLAEDRFDGGGGGADGGGPSVEKLFYPKM